MAHQFNLKAGKTEFFLQDGRELRVYQTDAQGTERISNSYDVCGTILFTALARLVYETSVKFPRKEEFGRTGPTNKYLPEALQLQISAPLPILRKSHSTTADDIRSINHYIQDNGFYGDIAVYARTRDSLHILQKRTQGEREITFSSDCPETIVTVDSLESVNIIHKDEAMQVMALLYSFHIDDSPEELARTETLDALLDYAYQEIESNPNCH